MKPSPVTEGVHDATIRRQNAQGVSDAAIARDLGVHQKRVSARRKALGLPSVKSAEPRPCKAPPLGADDNPRVEWRLDTDAFGALAPMSPQGCVIRFRPRSMPARPESGAARIGSAAGMCAEVRS